MNINICIYITIIGFITFIFFGIFNSFRISTKGIKRLSSAERALIIMPDDTKDILVGLLLGDGHIVRRSLTGNSRFVYAQTSILHKEYFNYVFSFFISLCTTDYKPQSRIFKDKRSNKTYSAISFTTMQLPCFNTFRNMFYKLNIKKVPDNIYDLLTPKGLAFWIMDDGSLQGSGLHISVYAFTNEDVDKLMYTLQHKFNLKCSIHYNRDNKPRIYIFKESIGTLITLVKPYFIDKMLYKLGL